MPAAQAAGGFAEAKRTTGFEPATLSLQFARNVVCYGRNKVRGGHYEGGEPCHVDDPSRSSRWQSVRS